MKKFKDLGVKPIQPAFIGKSIEIGEILNQNIIVHHYSIDPSKFPDKGNGLRLTMQIEYEGKKRVIFTGSVVLQTLIRQIPDADFPFETIIKKNEKRYEFT